LCLGKELDVNEQLHLTCNSEVTLIQIQYQAQVLELELPAARIHGCKYHVENNDDGTPYSTKHKLACTEQSQAFYELLKDMSERPQEYVTSKGKLTTNSIKGFHGLALKYRNKKVDLNTIHYCCNTNMAICHKNLGPIWKIICMCAMGIQMPENVVLYIISEQILWNGQCRNSDLYRHYRSLAKRKAVQRHEDEKSYMTTFNLKLQGIVLQSM